MPWPKVGEANLRVGPPDLLAKRWLPAPANEPLRDYALGSIELPLVIGGKQVATGRFGSAVVPHEHQHIPVDLHLTDATEVSVQQ